MRRRSATWQPAIGQALYGRAATLSSGDFFCGQRSVRLVLSLGYMGGNFCDGCISFVFCHEKKQEHVDLHCSAMQTCPARCQRMHLALECADIIEDAASTQNCWGMKNKVYEMKAACQPCKSWRTIMIKLSPFVQHTIFREKSNFQPQTIAKV